MHIYSLYLFWFFFLLSSFTSIKQALRFTLWVKQSLVSISRFTLPKYWYTCLLRRYFFSHKYPRLLRGLLISLIFDQFSSFCPTVNMVYVQPIHCFVQIFSTVTISKKEEEKRSTNKENETYVPRNKIWKLQSLRNV